MAVSFKYYLGRLSKAAYLLGQTTVAQTELLMWEGKKKYPKGTQVLKQLVSSRNTQKY